MTVTDSIARLRQTGERLPDDTRAAILADGPAHVDELLAIVVDDDLAMVDAPGDGWPPIHAVELLAEIGDPKGMDIMLEALLRTGWDSILHDRLMSRLPAFDAHILEPALAALATTEDPDQRQSICAVLSGLRVRDDRVFNALVPLLDEEVMTGVLYLSEYGDPRALPYVEKAFRAYEPDVTSPVAIMDLNEFAHAYEQL
ncbi:MAG: hypothetical protein ACHREM_20375, partial [Polyangiales bacterium]